MRHPFSILFISLLIFCTSSFAQSYDKMWRNISEYQKKDLPQSVINQAYVIFDKACQEKNSPQIIKSFLTAMQYREEISADSLNKDITSLEKLASESSKIEEKALLYSILARIKSDSDPDKALVYIGNSMRDASKVVELSGDTYKPIIKSGDISEKYFKNNLLHIIADINLKSINRMNNSSWDRKKILDYKINSISDFEKLEIVPSSDKDLSRQYLIIYQTLLRQYKRIGMVDAWIITASDLLNELKYYVKGYNDSNVSNSLEKLIKENSQQVSSAYARSILIENKYSNEDYIEALKLIRSTIAEYPGYVRIGYIKDREKDILSESLSASTNNLYAGVENKLQVSYRNVTSMKMNLYSMDSSITPIDIYNNPDTRDIIKKKGSLVNSNVYNLTKFNDYKFHNEEVAIRIDNPGLYYLELQTENGVKDGRIITVTSFLPFIQALPGDKTRVVILDALNGKPVEDADFNIYSESAEKRKLQLFKKIKSGSDGIIYIDSNREFRKYNITKGKDISMELTNFNSDVYRSFTDYKKERVALFTDRSIYKPGQTVNFSGFAYTQVDDSSKVLPLKEYEVTLSDANHVAISSINVTTDKYGAFSGRFNLPNASLNGRFCIKVISCETSFMVEEYKSPSFQVEFMPIKESFAIGDTVNVVGYVKTLWGIALPNVSVKYKISNAPLYMRNAEPIEEKELKSDEKGYFSIPITISENEDKLSKYWYRQYVLSAVATDKSGESVENSISIPYGSSSLVIDCEGLKDIVLKENNDSVVYRVKNLSGEEIDSKVLLKLYKIREEGKDSLLVLDRTEKANTKLDINWAKNLQSGRYRIVLQSFDTNNREVQYSNNITLFSESDSRPPIDSNFWIYDDGAEGSLLSFGTSKKDADIYYSILAKDKIIEDRVYSVSDSIINMDCSYKKEYGDGVEISIAFVKDGKIYTYSKEIVKPYPSKELLLRWETFRDKLQPGKKEEWKLEITYPDGKAADAQLMCTMYDASLDEIYKDRWNFGIFYTRDIYRYPFSSFQGESCFFNIAENVSYNRDYRQEFSYLDLPYINGNERVFSPVRYEKAAMGVSMLSVNKMDMSSMMKPKAIMSRSGDESTVTVRKDFSETAFFYPLMNTDKNGVVKISFTLPESLTKWHFTGFAHTEDVYSGLIDADIVSFKDFMVKPELPRFLRSGDRCVIPVSVTNLKDRVAKGDLSIEMIEPATNKVVFSSVHEFDVHEGDMKTYQFEYTVPENYSMLICRIIGKCKKFSDGEQNFVPILSDKEMVTESVPMIMSDKGKYNFSVTPSKDKKIVLEVTANPIWHVVQSIPGIITPRDNSAYSWATSLYASFVNEYILKNNPAIHNLSSAYKSTPEAVQDDMVLSELQKNQELKEIILSETPWVAQANKEESQRKMLSQIADLNFINYNREIAAQHLSDLQNNDGSWSWYKSMSGNISVTSDILEALVRIKILTGEEFSGEINRMYLSAFNYLKDEAEKCYKNDIKKSGSTAEGYDIPQWLVKYLYLSNLDKSLKYDEKVNSYFIDKLKDSASSLDIYQKSLAAVIFYKSGAKSDAEDFINSLLQYTRYTKDMGRYFDTKKAKYTYSSNIIPSVVSTIEALKLSSGKEDYISQMKQWLIAVKGIQSWSSNMAITNAIYALLGDEDVTSDKSGSGFIKINVGKESFVVDKNVPLGYIMRDIVNSVSNISIEKTYPGLSYGAIYMQGLEKVDTLREASTGLSIKKRLYLGDKVIDENTILKVGDVIRVQLIIDSPAYMDFVQIKDPLYSCMQPREQLSSVLWSDGMLYNKQVRNASVNLFVDKLGKGIHTLSYDVYITKRGTFKSGLTIAESAYFPMLRSFSSSQTLNVE